MKILIKYASRGRPDLYKQSIENITQSIKTDNYNILVTADRDDLTMYDTDILEFNKKYPKVKAIYGYSVSKVHAINRDLERLEEFGFADFDLLINFSDDMKFVVNGWDEIMVNLIKQRWPDTLDFFAHFNDGYVGDKLPTMSIMGREYYERFGWIYAPFYKGFSCDAEAMFVAQMLEKHHYFETLLFKHLHPSNDPQNVPSDATYQLNDKFGHPDTEMYFKRKAKLFYVNNPACVPFNPHDRS